MTMVTEIKFDKVEHLSDVAKLRHEIINDLKKHKMIREEIIEDFTSEINPCIGRLEQTGAIGVEFSYGYPCAIYSAYGKVRLGIPAMSENWGNYGEQNILFNEMATKYGLHMVKPAFKKHSHEFGPYYAVSRLPWKQNEKLPQMFTYVSSLNNTYEIKKAENNRAHADEILLQASQLLVKPNANAKKKKCTIEKGQNRFDQFELNYD